MSEDRLVHPNPEDAPCRGGKSPIIVILIGNVYLIVCEKDM